MTTIRFSRLAKISLSLSAAIVLMMGPAPAKAACSADGAKLIKNLAGAWQGGGSVTPIGGSKEPISCKIKYVSNGNDHLEQSLTCAGTDYRIAATSNVSCNGATISGSWLEQVAHNTGSVTGGIGPNYLNLEVDGPNFKGRFAVNFTSNDKHTVTITQFDPAKGRHVPVATVTLSR